MGGLHGIGMQSAGGGLRSITTVSTAIIGLIGTAPDAEGATAATVSLGSTLLDNAFTLTAGSTYPGRTGNALKVKAVAGAEAVEGEPPVTVALTKGELLLTMAVDATAEVLATAADVVEAINAAADIDIIAQTDGAGAGAVTPFASQVFSGGQDEPFPLNKPWIIAGSETQVARLGEAGTLKTAVAEILSQTGALIVGIRVDDAAAVRAEASLTGNIISGISGFLLAQTTTGNQPRVFIAPEFSEDDGVGKALETVATRMGGVAYLDMPAMSTPQEAVARRMKYGERVEILRPRVLTTDGDGQQVYRPYSAFAAGLRARIDSELGYWWSKSNQVVNGFSGVEQPDSWSIGDENSVANLLNMNNVSTIIQYGGFRHWGNRNCSTDPLRWFEPAVRTDDMLRASIQVGLFPYVDAPLDIMLARDAVESVNSYLREQKQLGAIHGGEAWLDPELNTEKTLAEGHLYIDYDYGFKSPAERITCQVHVNTEYAKEAFGGQ